MVKYKALYDNYTGCPGSRQVLTSMSLWVSGKKRGNIKVSTCGERPVTLKDYSRAMKTFQVNIGDKMLDYNSQGTSMYNVVGLTQTVKDHW